MSGWCLCIGLHLGLENRALSVSLKNLLTSLMTTLSSGKLLVVGDTNFHLDNHNLPATKQMLSLLASTYHEQHVKESVHEKDYTLDLIMTRCDDLLILVITYDDSVQSDHSALIFSVPIRPPSVKHRTVVLKKLVRDIDCQEFAKTLYLQTCTVPAECTAAEAVETYNDVFSCVLNKHAPPQSVLLLLWGLRCPGILWRLKLPKQIQETGAAMP